MIHAPIVALGYQPISFDLMTVLAVSRRDLDWNGGQVPGWKQATR
jgi:hypothetical protein